MPDIVKQAVQQAEDKIMEVIELKRNLLKTLDGECARISDKRKLQNLKQQYDKLQGEIAVLQNKLLKK